MTSFSLTETSDLPRERGPKLDRTRNAVILAQFLADESPSC